MRGITHLRPVCPSGRAALERCSAQRWRALQTSAVKPATPLPIPERPGRPPSPPEPEPSFPDNRIARKIKQAEMLRAGQNMKVDPSKPSSALKKRFWKSTSVQETDDGYQIMLDTRPLRGGASKAILKLPLSKPQLATAIAIEWDALITAQQATKQHYIPLTSLVSRAMDFEQEALEGKDKSRQQAVTVIMRYLSTDTLLCWAPAQSFYDSAKSDERSSQTLRQLQERTALPIMQYMTSYVWPAAEIYPVLEENSIVPTPQPEFTQETVRGWIYGLPAYDLAGLERGVLASKSLLVASRLLVEWSQEFERLREEIPEGLGRFTIEDAALACDIETAWQTQQWGEVEDTHDVNKEDLRRQLGSVVMLVSES